MLLAAVAIASQPRPSPHCPSGYGCPVPDTKELRDELHAWHHQHRTATEQAAALRCLDRGHGYWEPTEDQAYVIPQGSLGAVEYASCDKARAASLEHRDADKSKPPLPLGGARARKDAKFAWVPSSPAGTNNSDCNALLKGKSTPPPTSVLTRAFCERWAGKSVLIVGDSIQYESFLALSHLFGATPHLRCEAACSVCDEHRILGKPRALESVLCSHGTPETVTTARYITDGFLGLELSKNAPSAREREAGARSCNWENEMGESELLLLSLGTWAGNWTLDEHGERLEWILARVAARRAAASLPPLSEGVVLRGTHAATPTCFEMPDPLPPEQLDLQKYIDTMPAQPKFVPKFEWHFFEARNNVTRRVAAAHNVPYFDVYRMTALRPGGRRPAFHDCLHYCLPGPPDDWARMLLMLWT